MEGLTKYKGLNHSLGYLKRQVIDSLVYARDHCPEFENAEQLFYWLKKRTKYLDDDDNAKENFNNTTGERTELFQTMQTLFQNGGVGDCDCFTITALACCLANGWTDIGIVLVGRKRKRAVHIYSYIDTDKGRQYMDLTNKYYNVQRPYKYRQELPLKINLNQLNMMLQLAEGELSRGRRAHHERHSPRRAPLQYIDIPSEEIKVREDYYDNMPHDEFAEMLAEEGHSLDDISMLCSARTDRKKQKASDKHDKKQANIEKKKATASKRIAAGEAKKTRADKKGSGKGMEIFDKVRDTAGKFGKGGGGGGDDDEPGSGGGGSSKKKSSDDDGLILGMTPGQLGMAAAGVGALIILGIVVTKKKPAKQAA